MANTSISIRTQPITRDKLAKILDNQQLIKLLENLTYDVTVNVPAATQVLQQVTQVLQQTDDDTLALLNSFGALAATAVALATQAGDGPPAPVQVLPDIPDDMTARVAALEARLAAAERLISDLREGPTP